MRLGDYQISWFLFKWKGFGIFVFPESVYYTFKIRIPWICEIKRLR